jgi:hypothetical protein
MPGIGKGGFDILPLVEGRVVHDNHASGQELGQKVLRHPRMMEDVGVVIDGKQFYGQERSFEQSISDLETRKSLGIHPAHAIPPARIYRFVTHILFFNRRAIDFAFLIALPSKSLLK